MYSQVFTFNPYILCCFGFTENLYYMKPYLEMHFPCKENQLFSGIHTLNALWRNSENVVTLHPPVPHQIPPTLPRPPGGSCFFSPCTSETHWQRILKCKAVHSLSIIMVKFHQFHQYFWSSSQFSFRGKEIAQSFQGVWRPWLKSTDLRTSHWKKRRISCFGGWKMPFNCKWTIQQSRFLSICFKKLLKDYYWKKPENDKAYYRVPQRSHSYRVCRTCLRNTGMQGWHCPSG